MKKISKGTFLRAHNSPLATAQSVQYGNSLFGDFTTVVQIEGLYFLREERIYYKDSYADDFNANYYQFADAKEALAYFADAETYADEYSTNNGTCAGGF